MTKRTLVKLDEKLLEITEDKDGKFKLKRITDDALVEVSLLEEGVEKALQNDLHRLTNEAYEELQKDFKRNVKQNALRQLGFNDNWGKWEVDHCNGRMSEVTSYMSTKVQQMFRDHYDSMVAEDVEELLKTVKKQVRDDFKKVFLQTCQQDVRRKAQEAAGAFVKQLMEKEVTKLQKKAIEQVQTAFLGRSPQPTDSNDD